MKAFIPTQLPKRPGRLGPNSGVIMTRKTVTNATTETVRATVNGDTPMAAKPDYKLIPWKELQASPTNPRRRINEETLESLADSIRTLGILEPLIVRQKDKKYEIVCGERRYRAASKAKVIELPCIVRELSDEQVLDIQIHENLHREDVHPMDEAYGYQFLKEKLACDVKELALRVGKSEGYVLNRLKLNLLIKEAQKDIDDSHLPLIYALELAKYTPEIQKLIYGEVYRKEGKYHGDRYVQIPLKGQTIPLKSLVEWINTNIHRLLSTAPFDPKATNLRTDGLACVNCPERTAAAVTLFEPNQIGKKDACLNPDCYRLKAENHVKKLRRELAEKAGIGPDEVPIVRTFCHSDGKEYLGTESATVIDGKRGTPKTCKSVVIGIDIESDNYGRTVQVCLKSSGCKIHWSERKAPHQHFTKERCAEAESAERLEAHRVRREEIWNAKVAEAVRIRVFKQAAESFEKKFSIADIGIDFLPQLIARFWRMTGSGDSNNLNAVVKYILAEWESKSKDTEGFSIHDGRSAVEQFRKLKRHMQFRLLFLLIHCQKGTTGYGNNCISQKEVRDLAAEFEVDYAHLDAQVRLELCAKKHKQAHQIYLDSLRGKSKGANVPQLFSEKWKAKD